MTSQPRLLCIGGSIFAALAMLGLIVAARVYPALPFGAISKKLVDAWAYPLRLVWESISGTLRPEGSTMTIAIILSLLVYAALTGLLAGWVMSRLGSRAR